MFLTRHMQNRVERDHGRKVAAREIERHHIRTEERRLRDMLTGKLNLPWRQIHPGHREPISERSGHWLPGCTPKFENRRPNGDTLPDRGKCVRPRSTQAR